jgi:lysophospholipid acyltransferase (LPLAT)-like uncharacterized protein
MKVPEPVALALGPPALSWGVAALARTLRLDRDERAVSSLWSRRAPVIYAVWHARLLLLPHLYRGRRLRVLTSRSRDGELAARLAERAGLECVRGSSSRGAAAALRALLRSLREGWEVLVVPDGPRGPREVVKPGIVALAGLSGAPIVPVTVGASAAWQLDSWDRFRVPKPFARCLVAFGEPLWLPRDADGEAAMEVQAALVGLTTRVDIQVAA